MAREKEVTPKYYKVSKFGIIGKDGLELRTEVTDVSFHEACLANEPIITLGENIQLENTGRSDVGYFRCYKVRYKSQALGELYYQSKNANMAEKRQGNLTINNEILYRKDCMKLIQEFYRDSTVLEYCGILTLHICYDTQDNLIDRIKYCLNSKVFEKIGSAAIGTWDDEGYGYNIGKSYKQITVYNKSEESKTRDKPYIKDFWKANGLEVTSDVYRFELKLTNKALSKSDYDYMQLDNPEYLASIMSTEITNYFFGFRYIGKAKNAKSLYGLDDTNRVQFVNLKDIKGHLLEKKRVVFRDERITARVVINFLNNKVPLTDDESEIIGQTINIVRNKFGLSEYNLCNTKKLSSYYPMLHN